MGPSKKGNISIIAYGFDKFGFKVPERRDIEIGNNISIKMVNYRDKIDLSEGDGAIIPQGVFEKFWFGFITSDSDLILNFYRQFKNLIDDGKWICFLVKEIYDRLGNKDFKETDLCKIILNEFHILRSVHEQGLREVYARDDSFRNYVRAYGIGKTLFTLPPENIDAVTLISMKNQDHVLGFVISNSIFFLPFLSVNTDSEALVEVLKSTIHPILEYRNKNTIPMPPWLNDFQFNDEQNLRAEYKALWERLQTLNQTLRKEQNCKSILTISGENLRLKIIEILQDYFGFMIDATDQKREDAKILDEHGKLIGLVEIKGKKGGIQREDVSQLNFHQDRASLSDSIPGLLIMNCDIRIEGIIERLNSQIPREQIQYARNENILIIRTIDLLFLMRSLEDKSVIERKQVFNLLLHSGGGWLKGTSTGYEIINKLP